jgi:hypothetical protein
MGRREASDPLEGLEGAGLLGKVGRQPRHDLRRPGIPHQGERLWLNKPARIMALDQHGILLTMVVMVSHAILQEDRAGLSCHGS